MKERVGGTRRGKLAIVATAVAVLGLLVASVSFANNLDNRTMVNAAKQVAKQDCRNTSGCRDYFVRGMHRVSRHKGVGKIGVLSEKNGVQFLCVRQIVIKLDHFTGEINYAVSQRRCDEVGPA
jgi:hypothetical protein